MLLLSVKCSPDPDNLRLARPAASSLRCAAAIHPFAAFSPERQNLGSPILKAELAARVKNAWLEFGFLGTIK